ncbi:hypothetical protein ACOMHN_056256 [Nucella lapillus]
MAAKRQELTGDGRHISGVLVLVIASFVMPMAEARDLCAVAVEGAANGCSAPFNFPFKQQFTPSCNSHDVCYGCGALYGLSRADCDEAFLDNMIVACLKKARGRRHVGLVPHSDPLTEPSRNQAAGGRQGRQVLRPSPAVGDVHLDNIPLFLSEKIAAMNSRDKDHGPVHSQNKMLVRKEFFHTIQYLITRSFPSSSRKGLDLQAQNTLLDIPEYYPHSRSTRRMRSERRKREAFLCKSVAHSMYGAVHLFGWLFYSERGQTASYCPTRWVNSCLPALPPTSKKTP